MKKLAALMFVCFNVLFAASEDTSIDIRKYHQPMEEKVFELEDGEEQQKKIDEAFLMGKKRIEDLKKNELELLDLETKAGMERAEEIKYIDEKYAEILAEYSKAMSEKELILLENKTYEEQLKRFDELEKNLKSTDK